MFPFTSKMRCIIWTLQPRYDWTNFILYPAAAAFSPKQYFKRDYQLCQRCWREMHWIWSYHLQLSSGEYSNNISIQHPIFFYSNIHFYLSQRSLLIFMPVLWKTRSSMIDDVIVHCSLVERLNAAIFIPSFFILDWRTSLRE